ncbi:MAG: ABC transporter substrate-binding protein [Marinobacter sp.]|uniref:ABC transporter substrate-binding protein n=1 Tax=Marinobacter sp. TaxID=50741 RepID=UPI001B44B25C|nr:ABC transporter substrate-binding protein [Marinobacter sp.]MBQ0747825.1 ABC transporter substrate-binding protein [Marinobacter sp.]MBQ0815622.1 ABC transporter substrate-binding protein [Marinobacter sp.]|tara:strand:- start:1945 stop:3105 length:1161 start_codon:yes stop_codon:yes gene_type:complete
MFKNITRRASTFAAIAAAGLLAINVQAAEPIRIGSFLSVTGPASFLGDPELKTLEMYVEKINADGGVLGRQLELIHYDDAGNASKARNFASRLIRSDRVDIIVGGSTTGATMAAVPMVEQAGVPFISLAGAVVITNPVKKWVFKTPQTDRMAAERVLNDMKARGLTKVGLISGTGGFGSSGREQTLAAAKEMGGIEIVADETYGGSDTDMTAQLTNIRGAEGVQTILNFGFGQGPAIVTRNYAQLGIELPFYQSHGVASDGFLELAGSSADGLRLPASPLLVPDSLPESDPQKPVVEAYKSEYEARWNAKVSTFGAYAYDGLMLAVEAIEKAGTTDKAAVRDALETIQGHVGVTGTFNMSADDHNGLQADSFRILEVQDGGWNLIN